MSASAAQLAGISAVDDALQVGLEPELVDGEDRRPVAALQAQRAAVGAVADAVDRLAADAGRRRRRSRAPGRVSCARVRPLLRVDHAQLAGAERGERVGARVAQARACARRRRAARVAPQTFGTRVSRSTTRMRALATRPTLVPG